MMPACRHAPPNRILSRRASRMCSRVPQTSEPIGRAQPLRDAEHHGVDLARVLRHVHAGRDRGVEDPRAVQMDREPVVVGDLADRAKLLDGHDGAARVADGVLHRQQVDDLDVVRVLRLDELAREIGRHPRLRAGVARPERDARQDRRRHQLGAGDVSARRRAPPDGPTPARGAGRRSGWPSCRWARRARPPCP